MNWTNAIGTITAILTVVSGIMTQVLGCTPGTADFAATCTAPWLGQYSAVAALIFGGILFLMKLARPGGILRSLFGSTAVIVPPEKAKAGVVTQTQVESTSAFK